MVKIGKNTYDSMYITPEYGNDIQDVNLIKIKPYLKGIKNVIDIGANLGTFPILYSQEMKYTHFFCFEPTKDISNHASNNLNNANINHTMYNVALSNFNGKAGLLHHGNHQQNKLTLLKTDNEIEVRTLDSYAFQDVSLIKIDVEGHEMEVLEGSIKTINSNRPIIILEYHPEADSDSILKFIDEIEYTTHHLENNGIFLTNVCSQMLLLPNEKDFYENI
jgi:FkbM family methyltransferase